jgi:CshA-type fibril repeat protein
VGFSKNYTFIKNFLKARASGIFFHKSPHLKIAFILSLFPFMLRSEIVNHTLNLIKLPKLEEAVKNMIGFTIDPVSNVSVNENAVYTGVTPSITGAINGSLKYTLSGPDAFDFTINPVTGIVSMIGRNFESPADANGDNIYELTIKATDSANDTDTEDWTVTVLDIAEMATFTINSIANVTMNENSAYTSVVPAINGTPIGGTTPANFTIVPIPDTQYYTGEINGGTNLTFKAQSNWIVSNKSPLNIKYLVHLGDCVQNGDNGGDNTEWLRVDESVSIFEDPITTGLPFGIPYGLNVGNHDQSPDGTAAGTTNFFNQYFGSLRFNGRDYYGGHYGTNNDNNFQLFSAGGMDFIAVNMEYDPLANPLVLEWADNLLKAYPTRRAIISSHFIINPTGDFGAQGQAIYTKLKVNPNLFLMLCGHRNPNGEAMRTDTDGTTGKTVTTLLSDFQDRPNGGNGWMRFMEFMPSENKIYVSTYSPTLDEYETDANSKFAIDYTMTTGVNPGSVTYSLGGNDASLFTINASTGVVSMVAKDFESPADANHNNIYEVTVIATDTDGNTASKPWTVTIANMNEPATFNINPIENLTIDENIAYTGITPVISGTPHGNVTYILGGNDAADFTINPNTGVVTMVARNYESPADVNGDNIYELFIKATDNDGNSDSEDWAVSIRQGPADAALSTLSPANSNIIADGVSTQILIIKAKDGSGDFQTRGGASVDVIKVSGIATVSAVTDNDNGTYSAMVTSPAQSGQAVFTATINGQALKGGTANISQATVSFIPGQASLTTSILSPAQTQIIADGITSSIITLKLIDANGNALSNSAGTVSMNASAGTLGNLTDNNNGTYQAVLVSGVTVNQAVVTAALNGSTLEKNALVNFIAGPASTGKSTIVASNRIISYNGNTSSEIKVQLKDDRGNNLSTGGNTISFNSPAGALSTVQDNNDGTYITTLTRGILTGSANVNFTINGSPAAQTATVIIENNIPVLKDDLVCTIENTPVTLNPLANDTELDGSFDLSSLDLSPLAGIQNTLTVPGEGTYTANADGIILFTPVSAFKGLSTPVSYSIKDNDGALASPAVINVFVNPKPGVSIAITSGSGVICAGSSITFTATPLNVSAGAVYQWKINGINTGGNTSTFTTADLTNGQTVSCIISYKGHCGDALTATSNVIPVEVKPLPNAVVTPSGPLTFFSGGNVNLSTASLSGSSYQWLKDGIPVLAANLAEYRTSETGSYSVVVTSNSCAATSIPVKVNVVFNLPLNNFSVSATAEACKTSDNGSIQISAVQYRNYTAIITGNNTSISQKFVNSLDIKNLQSGTYTVCITLDGYPDYKQCYNVVVKEPKDLALYSSIKTVDNTLSLKMEGAAMYNIELNGILYTTTEDQITLPLIKGANKLKVSTANVCQGVVERVIALSSIYPNPFNDKLNINLVDQLSGIAGVDIMSYEGKRVHYARHNVENGQITLDLPGLSPGLYLLKLTVGSSETIYKIEKR